MRDAHGCLIELTERIKSLEVAIRALEHGEKEANREHISNLLALKQSLVDARELERARHQAMADTMQNFF